MKKEFKDKIIGEFPGFLSNRCELSIGDGWFDLFYKLCQDVKELNPKEFHFEQVKEKFGGLRAYYAIVEDDKELKDKVYKIVGKAESDSYKTCEECGSTENVSTDVVGSGSWIVSRCAKCRAE